MTPIKVIVTVFVLVVLGRTWQRRRRGELSPREAFAWSVLWALVLLASLWPHATDVAARWVGIGRGADLLIFVSVVALFALVSWLLARVERLERSLTQVVRASALRHGESGMVNRESGDRIDPADGAHDS